MKISFKRFILLFLIFIVVLFGCLTAWVYLQRDRLKQFAIEQVNQNILAKVEVEHVDFTLFQQFPDASIDFRRVHISEPGADKHTLLNVAHLYVSFNLYDILMGVYTIQKIDLDSGFCSLKTDQSGHNNFSIFKSTSDSTNTFIHLKQVNIHHVKIISSDDQDERNFSGFIQESQLSFKHNNPLNFIHVKAQMAEVNFQSSKLHIIKNQTISLNTSFEFNDALKLITLQETHLTIGTMPFEINGNYQFQRQPFINLHAEAPNATIQGLISLLPIKFPEQLKQYESEGKIKFKMWVKGFMTNHHQPNFGVDFSVKDGHLIEPNTKTTITHINCNGTFTGKQFKTAAKLELSTLNFSLNQGMFNGKLAIVYNKEPMLSLSGKTSLSLTDLLQFVQNKNITVSSGNIEGEFTIQGRLRSLTSFNPSDLQTSGNFKFNAKDVNYLNHAVAQEINGDFDFDNNVLNLHQIKFSQGSSDIAIHGKLNGVIPFIFGHQTLTASLICNSHQFNPEDLFLSESPQLHGDSTGIQLPAHVLMNIQFNTDHFIYKEFEAKNAEIEFTYQKHHFNLKQLKALTMNGEISVTGNADHSENGQWLVTAKSALNKINIKELFKSCANFGQQEITYQHLNGILSGDIEMISVWDANWTCLTDKLYVNSNLQIVNGELNQYKPLESLSRYADVEELRNLRFAALNNQIQISNRTIFIPEMELSNNALNLTLSGTHTFDQMIDYRFKIKLKELLTSKRKKKGNEYGEEDESDKGMYLYLTMKGTMDAPKISYDKIGVKNKVIKDLGNEKENIKALFKKELGLGKDTLIHEKEQGKENDELEFEP